MLKKRNLILSLIFATLGFIALWNFEIMAYWGNNTMFWFWIGALFTYLCAISSLFFLWLAFKTSAKTMTTIFIATSLSLIPLFTFFGTSLAVYVWYLKDFSL